MRTLKVIIPPERDGSTVMHILRTQLHMPESLVAAVKLRETGFLLNGSRCRTVDRVHSGDTLEAKVGDIPSETGIIPYPMKLDICCEDADLLILNKPAGIPVHAFAGVAEPSIPAALAAYWGTDQAMHDVNRLDKGTSGLMVLAKSGYIHDRLRRMLHTDGFLREYLAICVGDFPQQITVQQPVDGKTAVTHFQRIWQGEEYALIRAKLTTGRRHQIRQHCAFLGCPLLGDMTYGKPSPLLDRPALHSYRVRLTHPVTGQTINCTAELPEELRSLLTAELQNDIQGGAL